MKRFNIFFWHDRENTCLYLAQLDKGNILILNDMFDRCFAAYEIELRIAAYDYKLAVISKTNCIILTILFALP